MSDTNDVFSLTSEKVKGDGYYGFSDGLHTVSVKFTNFIGGFGIEATLSIDPSEDDWFPINLSNYNSNNEGFIRFPQNELAPTGAKGGDTGTEAFSFIGNFTYVRAVMTRDYFDSVPDNNVVPYDKSYGAIDRVLLAV